MPWNCPPSLSKSTVRRAVSSLEFSVVFSVPGRQFFSNSGGMDSSFKTVYLKRVRNQKLYRWWGSHCTVRKRHRLEEEVDKWKRGLGSGQVLVTVQRILNHAEWCSLLTHTASWCGHMPFILKKMWNQSRVSFKGWYDQLCILEKNWSKCFMGLGGEWVRQVAAVMTPMRKSCLT